MSRLAKIPLYGNIAKAVTVNLAATEGAQIGVNLLLDDGTLATTAKLKTLFGAGTSSATGPDTTDALDEGSFHLYFTDRRAQDAVGSILADSANVSLSYVGGVSITADLIDLTDSGAGAALVKITRDSKGRIAGTSAATTSDLMEGSNLYYTDARADARITAQKGVANGLAPLESDGKISVTYLPASVLGQVSYQGTWDASAGTPPTATPDKGWYYIVTVAGSTSLSGITDWKVGDWAIYNGAAWDKVDNTDSVVTVNGYTGAVNLTAADVGAEPAITAGTIAQYWRGDKGWQDFATDVRAAVLTGLSVATSAVISATDTVLQALGKLQAQVSGKLDKSGGTMTGSLTFSSGSIILSQGSLGTYGPGATLGMGDRVTSNQYSYFSSSDILYTYSSLAGFLNQVDSTGNFSPSVDNTRSCGKAALRWSVIYAGTGTINTSDAREKTAISPLTSAEIAAAIDLAKEIGTYQWLESVSTKGANNARLHAGLTVQRAMDVMQSHGLDPFRYGFICYDQWQASNEIVDPESGEVIQAARPSGDRYSFRTDELNLFLVRGLDARISALEAKATP